MKPTASVALIAGTAAWCLVLIAAPLLHLPAVYALFRIICHQDAARSWHILGEPLPACIRCASIYLGFFVSLCIGLSFSVRWLRCALVVMIFEFVVAQLVVDTAVARSFAGILFGLTAAPFVRRGIEEMTRESM